MIVYNYDVDLEMSDTCACSSLELSSVELICALTHYTLQHGYTVVCRQHSYYYINLHTLPGVDSSRKCHHRVFRHSEDTRNRQTVH